MNKHNTLVACSLFSLLLLGTANGGEMTPETQPSIRISQSIGTPAARPADNLKRQLDLAPLQIEPGLLLSGSRKEGFDIQQRLSAHPGDYQHYRIYDAETSLTHDEDADGFYSLLRVTFDADVDLGNSEVYAMLYLSYEGGPWNHYYSTDIFPIHEDASHDQYEVVTQLLEGYSSGYYDILIELYEADSDRHVASFGPYEDDALAVLPLEDQWHDQIYVHSHGGGGGYGLVGLIILLLAGITRRPAR